MNEQELCRKRLLDLSRQADRKGIVLFSDFLNLNEQNIFHSLQKELYTTAKLSGGYEQAERQMVAFILMLFVMNGLIRLFVSMRFPSIQNMRKNLRIAMYWGH